MSQRPVCVRARKQQSLWAFLSPQRLACLHRGFGPYPLPQRSVFLPRRESGPQPLPQRSAHPRLLLQKSENQEALTPPSFLLLPSQRWSSSATLTMNELSGLQFAQLHFTHARIPVCYTDAHSPPTSSMQSNRTACTAACEDRDRVPPIPNCACC